MVFHKVIVLEDIFRPCSPSPAGLSPVLAPKLHQGMTSTYARISARAVTIGTA